LSEETEELISGVKGKIAELRGSVELLRYNFSVYAPLVDTGIDCLIGDGKGNYKEIQVKYREDHARFRLKAFKPRDSLYIMCYLNTRHDETYWVIPSKIFEKMASHTKRYVHLRIGKEGSESYEALRKYQRNLSQLLKGATRATRQTVQQRIKELQFKPKDFEYYLCNVLFVAGAPTATEFILTNLDYDLSNRFSPADLKKTKQGIPRWKENAVVAITNLRRKKLVEEVTKNVFMLTSKGRKFVEVSIPKPLQFRWTNEFKALSWYDVPKKAGQS
jgi:hypothetical protein